MVNKEQFSGTCTTLVIINEKDKSIYPNVCLADGILQKNGHHQYG
jgi:hypothetical protein